ncbi:hypothetical protein ACFPRL_10350 [Pseudoclavibacter helvolus]
MCRSSSCAPKSEFVRGVRSAGESAVASGGGPIVRVNGCGVGGINPSWTWGSVVYLHTVILARLANDYPLLA